MDIVTIDFETYWDKDFSLSKMTTEAYIRDPRFEVIGVSVKLNDQEVDWYSGADPGGFLHALDYRNRAILCHNTAFDGAILSWKYGIKPKLWLDTLSMARPLHSMTVGGSLKALATYYELGDKGDEVMRTQGLRRRDFTPEQMSAFAEYCVQDVNLTYRLFRKMVRQFPKEELLVIDQTIRMYTEPKFELDPVVLDAHLAAIHERKQKLLEKLGGEEKAKKFLMSNAKFADLLRAFGVEPPMKTSPTTGKQTYAFAKNDTAFTALLEHPKAAVRTIVEARLGTKSTIEETRTDRFLEIAERGPLPIMLNYYGAHTGRFSGGDKINLQNLPSRGPNAKKLKRAIIAPEGYSIVESDSSQIEARTLAWLAGQEDVVETFAAKGDVYKKMASAIYGVPIDQVTKDQRHVGKTTVLGAGYGMGGEKFQAALKNGFPSVDLPLHETKRIIAVYREANWAIADLWKRAGVMLQYLARGGSVPFGRNDLLVPDPEVPGVRLPNGLLIRYDDLRARQGEKGVEYVYDTRKGPSRIYGGKVIENVTQALARIIIGEQMLRIAKRYRVVLTVHDSIVCCVPDEEVEECKAYVEESMRWTPDWAKGLPVDCEAGVGKNYGDTE